MAAEIHSWQKEWHMGCPEMPALHGQGTTGGQSRWGKAGATGTRARVPWGSLGRMGMCCTGSHRMVCAEEGWTYIRALESPLAACGGWIVGGRSDGQFRGLG